MSKWIHSDVLRGAHMVMQIKQAALEGGLDNPISDITGCGVAVVANYLDALLKDWLDLTSRCADYKRDADMYKAECREWRDCGFDNSPDGMVEERVAELKALAKRWNDEDEAEMDADKLKEIEERRAKRENTRGNQQNPVP